MPLSVDTWVEINLEEPPYALMVRFPVIPYRHAPFAECVPVIDGQVVVKDILNRDHTYERGRPQSRPFGVGFTHLYMRQLNFAAGKSPLERQAEPHQCKGGADRFG